MPRTQSRASSAWNPPVGSRARWHARSHGIRRAAIIIVNDAHAPKPVSLLAILASLLAQHSYPPPRRQPLMAFYGRMCLSTAKRLNAGDRNSGLLAWLALMAAVLIPAALLTALAAAIHPFVVWLLD